MLIKARILHLKRLIGDLLFALGIIREMLIEYENGEILGVKMRVTLGILREGRMFVDCDGVEFKEKYTTPKSYKEEVVRGVTERAVIEGKLVNMDRAPSWYCLALFEFEADDKKASALKALLEMPAQKWKLWKEARDFFVKEKSVEEVLWKIAPAVLCEKL